MGQILILAGDPNSVSKFNFSTDAQFFFFFCHLMRQRVIVKFRFVSIYVTVCTCEAMN